MIPTTNKPLIYILLLIFWAVSLWGLARFPIITESESIPATGYKFFQEGVFGSDLFTGFYNAESHNFEFMPLMSLWQGGLASLAGLGVWQVRFPSVLAGLLLLAVTGRLARTLVTQSPQATRRQAALAGVLAISLLIFWQWTVAGNGVLIGSGIPLLDITRQPRHDILVPLLGLAALLVWVRGQRRSQQAYYMLSGVLAGLAGMAHLYGLLWVGVLVLLTLAGRRVSSVRQRATDALMIMAGAGVIWIIWLGAVAIHWTDYQGQMTRYRGRFDLFDPEFYRTNWTEEVRRWREWMGPKHTDRWGQVGYWLLLPGVPLAILLVGYRAWRKGDRPGIWLLVPVLLAILILALFIERKAYEYLILVVPLFAILVGIMLAEFWFSYRLPLRILTILLLFIMIGQGSQGILQIIQQSNRAADPAPFFRALQVIIPPATRVLGVPQYWLALPENEYRSFGLPLFLANPRMMADPLPIDAALTAVNPDIIILSRTLESWLRDDVDAAAAERNRQFWAYMAKQEAELIEEITGSDGERLRIYQLGADNSPGMNGYPRIRVNQK